MKRLALASLAVAVAASWLLIAEEPKTDAKKIDLNGHSFTLPPGFEIELIAGPPLVDRPISAAFDDRGRLYVTESLGVGTREKTKDQLVKKPYRIVRLEDTKGNGHFDKRTIFVEKIMFPEGALWYDGSLYVCAPPSIWKLTDTTGNGVADQQVEWFQGKTLNGCANDLHGPYLGPDGWIYWCKGAFERQTYERPGKPPFVTRAAHIFRSRPDGSGLEPVMTGGMDNPVGLAFTPTGDRIFSTTFLQHPAAGKRDGMIHAIYGGIYGKDHDVIYDRDHKWTSPALMPVLTHLGPAAPCGMTRYESSVFGSDYRDSLFTCQFNLQKVSRHVLKPDGASFKTEDSDFVVSSNHDFHPTDVLEDADGSLLVVDTGGWYKLCCPSSQLEKTEVLGGIYRIRRKDAPAVDDPRGLKLAWEKLSAKELAGLLGDVRPTVQHRAMQTLAKNKDAVPVLVETLHSSSAEVRRNAVWTAARIDQAEARAAVRSALTDADATVRQAALHCVSLQRDREALPTLLKLLKTTSPRDQRAAAEAIGRIGDKTAVAALLDAVGMATDRVLEHSLTYALIEIDDREGTAPALTSKNPLIRRAALVALDQMDGSKLDVATVTPDLTSTTPALKETATWIVGRHPEWAGELVGSFHVRLGAKDMKDADRDELVRQLARFARAKPIQELLAERLRGPSVSTDGRRLAMQAMAQAGLKETPAAWLDGLAALLAVDDEAVIPEVLTTVRALTIPKERTDKITSALLRIATSDQAPVNTRLRALAAAPGGLAEVKSPVFELLVKHVDAEQPQVLRSLAADVLSRSKLTTDQLLALSDALKNTGPMEVDRLLETFVQSKDEPVGLRVLAALNVSPIRGSLRIDMIKPRLAKYNAAVQTKAEELYAILDADAAKQREHLDHLLATLEKGDAVRGQVIFNSQKTACVSCHTIGYVGGKVGPDLTRIGLLRNERDLLESVVYPSASFVRSYEPVRVTTKKGKTYNGVIRKDGLDEIVLALDATNEVRLARDDIDDMQPSKVSIMPAGLDKQLTPRELADLLAFLKACRR
jgi:putative membrane-bound dehydrogenase-like protein